MIDRGCSFRNIWDMFPSHIIGCCLQILRVHQLYRICTQYWDDNYNTRSVSPDVSQEKQIDKNIVFQLLQDILFPFP
jgi:hypothetical protein